MRGFPAATLALPWSAATGVNDTFRFFDHFVAFAGSTPWLIVSGGAAPDYVERGEVFLPADGGAGTEIRLNGYAFYRASAPIVEMRVKTTTIAKGCMLYFATSAAGTWGIQFDPAASANWRVQNKVGGAWAYQASTTPVVAGTYYVLRLWLTGAVGAQTINLTIDGADLTQYSATAPVAGACTFGIWQDFGAAGGTGLSVDWFGIQADFSQVPA